MSISSTISTTKEREASGILVGPDSRMDKTVEPEAKAGGTTGTFVYLKARRGMKSGSAPEAAEEWRPKMWTYLR
jgi:hypothetical protein